MIPNENIRLNNDREKTQFWKKWGSYLSEREWGTVREDYSENGNPWDYLTHDHSRSYAYRWGEDGIAGISDYEQNLCFSITLWNGADPILKERLFGLNSKEGNHGEDVKELYYYLDNTPTHSYMKYLYKYPQAEFPYDDLVHENSIRGKKDPEYEILDTGVFDKNSYFDIFTEYAKINPEDIAIKIIINNRGENRSPIYILPTLWFRNCWSYNKEIDRPEIKLENGAFKASHHELGEYFLFWEGDKETLFTQNETNKKRLYNKTDDSLYTKDLFNRILVEGEKVNRIKQGTKAAILYYRELEGGESWEINLRLSKYRHKDPYNSEYKEIFNIRKSEADEFYNQYVALQVTDDAKNVQRQAFAGLLWSKQFYSYDIDRWQNGDNNNLNRSVKRNRHWLHLKNRNIISMPDTWEYPWYASWDLAFHMIPMAIIDSHFAKKQLILFLREWYMHPNGQMPAYEWNFSDVNPPVHAWAALKVYKIDRDYHGKADIKFLKRVFHKLLLNFTWWVNRKDAQGNNIFEGGFLGLDNIGVFDRSKNIPGGGRVEQADGTSWMAMYCLNMLEIAVEISNHDSTYEDVASKFFEHFTYIASSLNRVLSDTQGGLWCNSDGFFYDALHLPNGKAVPLKIRSLVGLTPLFAVTVLDRSALESLPLFLRRLKIFQEHRMKVGKDTVIEDMDTSKGMLFSLTKIDRLIRILEKMLDTNEFLTSGGIRSISKYHKRNPYELDVEGTKYSVNYEPGESETYVFGGNSNWRGPIWIPMNYLLIDALKRYDEYYGDTLKVEYPTGSGKRYTLGQVATDLAKRINNIFIRQSDGSRLVHGEETLYRDDPWFKELVLFYEYYHAESCKGLGASHQTGWSALVAEMISDAGCELGLCEL